LLYLSGQVAQDPTSGKLLESDVRAQTEQIFPNLTAAIEAAAKGLSEVIRVGVLSAGYL